MSEYKISLGVDVDVSDIQSQINTKAKDVSIPIKLEVENIGDIKKQIQGLGVLKGGIEIPLSIDSNATIKSAQQVGQKIGETTTKALKSSLNFDDTVNKEVLRLMSNWGVGGKKGTKTFDKAFNEIKQALISYKKGLVSMAGNADIMNPDDMLTTLMGSANIRKVMSSIANNKKIVDESQKKIDKKVLEYLKPYRDSKSGYKVQIPEGVKGAYLDKGVFSKERNRLGAAFNTSRGTTFESFISDFNDVTGNLIKSTNAIDQYFEFIDLIKDIDSRKQNKWQMSESQLLSSDYLRERDLADDISASIDAISAKEKELVQSSNATTDAIAQNSKRQQEAYENSSKANLDRIKSELEQAEQRKKEINNLIEDNNKRFQEATISGDADGILDSQNRMDELDAESKAIKAHIDTLNASYEQAANARKNITQQISGFDDAKQVLKNLDFNTNSLDKMIGDFEELGVTVKKVTHSLNKDGSITFNVEGIDEAKNVVKAVKTLKSDGSFGGFSSSVSQDLKSSEKFLKQQKQTVANLTNQINQLNRSAIDQNASRTIKDSTHLDALADKYDEITSAIQRMENASSDTFVDEQNNVRKLISEYKSLVSEFKNAENVSSKMKGTDFASGLDIAKNDLEKFKAQAKDFPQITATIQELDRAIENVGDASSLNKFNDQLRVARSELAKVKSETTAINRNEKVGINVSGLESKIADIQRISPEINRFETEIDGAKVSVQSLLNDLKQVKTQGDFSVVNSRFKAFAESAKAAGIAVSETAAKTKAALANDIKFDIDVGNFDNQIDAMRAKFNSLSDANTELRRSYNATEDAYKAMTNAAKANSGDEVADRERLIQSEKEYAAALEKTNNLIKQQARADKIDADNDRLEDKRKSLSLDMQNWLKNNTKAAKAYGDEIRRLNASLDKLDDIGVNKAGRQFKNITKDAERRGLTGLTWFDQVKDKFKQYASYFSVAEMFMYAEQGLESMFEQVKLIDSAMTELKKVTNESDASYNNFLTNAATRAKEIGTTIDGLVSSTADFARLGYDFVDSQGLAEVANIYAVVGDDIEGVEGATQSLISTMAAFKGEMNDMSDADFAMSIVDKMNEVDILAS